MSHSRNAAAPSVTASGAGVSVPRRFTEAGKHPFDCVEWDIRDALIGDPAKPAFDDEALLGRPCCLRSGPRHQFSPLTRLLG